MEFRILGPLQVLDEGRELPLGGQRWSRPSDPSGEDGSDLPGLPPAPASEA